MVAYKKDQITFLFVCYNESLRLPILIEILQHAGFQNFLVIDNNSTDGTAELAEKAGAQVVNHVSLNFADSLLKGLFMINSPGVVVIANPYVGIVAGVLENFVEFGVIGEYPLLFSSPKERPGLGISKILREKYGLYIDEPGFEAVFLNKQMQGFVKKRLTGNAPDAFIELIKVAIDEKLKIGVRRSGVVALPEELSSADWLRRRKRLKYEKLHRKNYMKVAFPGLHPEQTRNRITVGVVTGVAVTVLAPLAAVGIARLSGWVLRLLHR